MFCFLGMSKYMQFSSVKYVVTILLSHSIEIYELFQVCFIVYDLKQGSFDLFFVWIVSDNLECTNLLIVSSSKC